MSLMAVEPRAEHGADLFAANGPIIVIDDVLPNPLAYRAAALALSYGDVAAGDQVFKGIAVPGADFNPALPTLPGLGPTTLTFFRKSPAGQEEPNYLHSDRDMGDWTAILYLNPDPPAGDGTSFWRHRETGAVCGDFDEAAARDLSQWERWRHVEAKFGRLLVFQADYFHSRGIAENYGEGDEARLIQVAFGRRPGPAGEVLIRPAVVTDTVAIVELGLRFLRESVYRGRIPENPEQMARFAQHLMASAEGEILVAERHGALVGMVGAMAFLHPLSGEFVASELFWWVNPDERGRTGLRLLRAVEQWAQGLGAVALTMIAPTSDVEQLYVRLKFDRLEVSYMRRF